MQVVKPYNIDETKLFSASIPEPDASQGEVVWVSGQSYTAGSIVIRLQTHRKYVALQNTTGAIPPENNPTNWKDVGPTNRYAAFDYTRNTASIGNATGLGSTFVVRPVQRVSCISIFGVDAQSIRIRKLTAPGGTVIQEWVFNLQTRFVTTWYEYLTEPFVFKNSAVQMNIPPTTNSTFEITFFKSVGLFSVESIVLGQPVFFGKLAYGASSDILDFSRIERDALGSAELVKRKNVPTLGGQIFVNKADVPKIVQFRKENQATPLVFLGLSDSSDDYFEAVSGLGIIKSMPILIEYPNHSLVNLEVEGL